MPSAASLATGKRSILSDVARLPIVESLGQSLARAPSSADLLNLLGVDRGVQGDPVASAKWFRRLVAVSPGSPDGVANLATAFVHAKQWAESIRWLRKTLALYPDRASAHYNLGVSSLHLGQFADTALSSARARSLDPALDDAFYNEAQARLALGDWARGFALYERRWLAPSFPVRWRGAPGQRWDGRPMPNGKLLLLAEQGHGDAIQFVRYAALAAPSVGRVVVSCPRSLMPLMARADGVDAVVDETAVPADFDLHLPILSFPSVFATQPTSVPAQVPYFRLDPARTAATKAALPAGCPLIGLCWKGNPTFVDDARRSPGIQILQKMLASPGARYVNLVKASDPDEVRELGLIDPMPRVRDFLDTAHVIASLDLVVTSDTAVAHLAGALGRPTWLLLAAAGDWRWLVDRTDTPWYPTMTLFRQRTLGDWSGVADRVENALHAWLRDPRWSAARTSLIIPRSHAP